MNKTIKILMLSDIFILTGFGLIAPILAIFFKDNITGGTIFTAGLASTIFLISKSIVQLPLAKHIDSHKNKITWLIIGTSLISLTPILYIFSSTIYHIYFIQVIHGFGAAMAYPTWLGLFSTHLDKKHESYEWGVYSTSAGIGAAITASAGAAIAQYFGFSYTFLLVAIMSLIGCTILFKLEDKHVKLKESSITHYHKRSKYTDRKHPY